MNFSSWALVHKGSCLQKWAFTSGFFVWFFPWNTFYLNNLRQCFIPASCSAVTPWAVWLSRCRKAIGVVGYVEYVHTGMANLWCSHHCIHFLSRRHWLSMACAASRYQHSTSVKRSALSQPTGLIKNVGYFQASIESSLQEELFWSLALVAAFTVVPLLPHRSSATKNFLNF